MATAKAQDIFDNFNRQKASKRGIGSGADQELNSLIQDRIDSWKKIKLYFRDNGKPEAEAQAKSMEKYWKEQKAAIQQK